MTTFASFLFFLLKEREREENLAYFFIERETPLRSRLSDSTRVWRLEAKEARREDTEDSRFFFPDMRFESEEINLSMTGETLGEEWQRRVCGDVIFVLFGLYQTSNTWRAKYKTWFCLPRERSQLADNALSTSKNRRRTHQSERIIHQWIFHWFFSSTKEKFSKITHIGMGRLDDRQTFFVFSSMRRKCRNLFRRSVWRTWQMW